MEQVEGEGSSGVASTAKRILKDSGRYLLAGVKAALAGAQTPASFVVDAWRQGHQDLQLERTSLSQVLNMCLARQTSACAEKGVDLLLEHGEPLPEARLDAGRLEAVLELMLDLARQASAQNRPVRVRSSAALNVVTVSVHVEPEGGAESLIIVEDSPLAVAREIAVAHGGTLEVERAQGPVSLRLTLPVPDAGTV